MRTPTLLAALLLCGAATAQAQSHRQTIIVQLDTASVTARGGGFTPDTRALGGSTSIIGLLPSGSSVAIDVTLEAGREYFIMGGCDTDCTDLDLRVQATDGQTTLAEDVADDDVPVVRFTAREGGPHLLSVMMPGCSTDLCYFGFRIHSKR